MKIYTRTGDTGETSLFSGDRARKDDPRVDAYGEIDELNAWLGLARASPLDPALAAELVALQREAVLWSSGNPSNHPPRTSGKG